jgi:hypothetical protein
VKLSLFRPDQKAAESSGALHRDLYRWVQSMLARFGDMASGPITNAGNITAKAAGSDLDLNGGTAQLGATYVDGFLTLPKASGSGIKTDTAAPTYGWRDILGRLQVRTTGASAPSFAVYRASGGATVSQFQFSNGASIKEEFLEFHMPHDWVPSSDLFIHAHWSQTTVDTGGPAGVPGTVKWNFDISYADGHGTAGGVADPFSAPFTTSMTQQASTTQYGHLIAEVQFTNAGGDATHLDRATLQVDGLLLVRVWRDSVDAADTLDQSPFLHQVDLHYQSTNVGTKQKAPSFYT